MWVIWFEDAEMDPELFVGHGAEDAAHARFDMVRSNWSCHLLERIKSDSTKEGE